VSRNLFVDLELLDPKESLFKTKLVLVIRELRRDLAQQLHIAERIGLGEQYLLKSGNSRQAPVAFTWYDICGIDIYLLAV
jgi:hypothetical protein